MKKISLYLMIFGTLICLLVLANFPQSIVKHELNLAYASSSSNPAPAPVPTQPVPEPSTMALLGTGVIAGAGIYLLSKYKNRKK